MSDLKSKLPDFKELASMGSKLFKGIKGSVEEIIQDYKAKRAETEVPTEVTPVQRPEVTPEKTPENPVESENKPK
ncbi:MAG: hypothetical protein EPN84_04580 [Legionella sp.]|nr:MAG: hypothetical protein EPN84_04580 [Legionella sp.]